MSLTVYLKRGDILQLDATEVMVHDMIFWRFHKKYHEVATFRIDEVTGYILPTQEETK